MNRFISFRMNGFTVETWLILFLYNIDLVLKFVLFPCHVFSLQFDAVTKIPNAQLNIKIFLTF